MKQYKQTDIDLGDNIARLRKERKMTQNYVANQLQLMGLKITRSRLSMIEQRRLNVPASLLIAIKTIFKCEYEDFFADLEDHYSGTIKSDY